jgi:hypothetical protein
MASVRSSFAVQVAIEGKDAIDADFRGRIGAFCIGSGQ